MLNKSKGNMYPWATHTWNPIRGRCQHDCNYCFMKRFPQKPLRLDKKALQDNLGEGNTIFVGSSTDMWAKAVPSEWIEKVIKACCAAPENTYLFQTKNPVRFKEFFDKTLPPNYIMGVTLETNRPTESLAPSPLDRNLAMLGWPYPEHKMVSVEPVMKFDREIFRNMIEIMHPKFVSIGADSGNNHLPEPSKEDLEWLIAELRKFTEVKIKDNLKRLLGS